MKKILLAILCGTLITACSNDDSSEVDYTDKLIFDISAVNKLENTRAGQPIYSQEAVHTITRVNVHAFKEVAGEYLFEKTYTVTSWASGLSSLQHIVNDTDKLSPGNYKFLAIGQRATDNYTLTTGSLGVTKHEDMAASIANLGDEHELFGAEGSAVIGADGGGRVKLDMIRKVGGVMVYVANVPKYLLGDSIMYLRLSTSDANKTVNIYNGTGSDSFSSVHNIINIDLSTQDVENGIFTGNDLEAEGIVKLANSQLAGAYLIPIQGVTLTLGLYNKDGQAVKEWTVLNGSETSHNILSNNFYSIGTKVKSDSLNGGTDDDDSDDDKAQDMLTNQEIGITISANWGPIHDLTIE